MVDVIDPPEVRIRVGEPVPLVHRRPTAATKRIMRAIVDLLPAAARERRIPTPAELARAVPPS